jgi:OmpA-OmpF porin, OOP family
MKKYFLFAVCLCLMFSLVKAQDQHPKQGIGVHVTGLDFYGPQTGNYLLSDKYSDNKKTVKKRLLWDPSIRISYWQTVHPKIDLSAGLQISTLQRPQSEEDSVYILAQNGQSRLRNAFPFVSGDIKGHWNFLPKFEHILSPYAAIGISGAFSDGNFGINVPVGIGCHVKLANAIFINIETGMRAGLSETFRTHLTHQIGLVYWWKSDKSPAPTPAVSLPAPPVLADMDNDGIPDSSDECPNLPGKRDLKGCPDTDGDGIADKDDNCPDIKGLAKYKGCPDSDGDGIADPDDECPGIAGIAKYKGCPIPDTDGDGFNDEVDKCPTVASKVNNGCPEIKQQDKAKIEMAAKGIFFETGNAIIKPSSFMNLDKVLEILQAEPTYLLDIEGHTDNTGTPERNLILSSERADACKKYLTDKGINPARITSKGLGDTMPAADNSNSEGRAKNRRTTFTIRN